MVDHIVLPPVLTVLRLELLLLEVGRVTRTPLGWERLPNEPAESERVGAHRALQPAPLRMADVFDHIGHVDPRYAWREDDCVITLRPVGAATARESLANRPVPALSVRHERPVDVVRRVLASLAVSEAGDRDPLARCPESPWFHDRAALVMRPVSFRTTGGTVATTLDALARAHGELMWIVQRGNDADDPRPNELRLLGYDGSGIACWPD